MKREYFGTDGVRGPYGGPLINEAFAERLGVAAGRFVSKRTPGGRHRALLGRDTRASSESLLQAVAAGLAAVDVESTVLGILPTPAVAAVVVRERVALGVMITASHNPASDNGIKFFNAAGGKFTDAEEFEMEQLLPADPPTVIYRKFRRADGVATYLATVQRLLPPGALQGWRIVVDNANGATCATSPVVLRALGAEVITLGDAPDGWNINAGVGSEHPEKLAERVRATGARLGIAHDGDGDRCVLCDERGEVLDGDEILTILATHALAHGALVKKTLIVTVQSNLGVEAALAAAGGRICRTPVGDRYVSERMLAEGATLGGETSGHIICSEVSPTGDGLVASLKVLEVMRATGRPLSELRGVLKKFSQRSAALTVRERKPLESLPALAAAIRALESELGAQGRVLVRYSGTEAKLRLLVEGPADAIVRAGLARLETAARVDLPAG
ncbi:MAG: phosphoglucosamine mutase [Opitutaceae bacterium]|nr:phosphoglucosamine mutase [Opitutaceae bacterium]